MLNDRARVPCCGEQVGQGPLVVGSRWDKAFAQTQFHTPSTSSLVSIFSCLVV